MERRVSKPRHRATATTTGPHLGLIQPRGPKLRRRSYDEATPSPDALAVTEQAHVVCADERISPMHRPTPRRPLGEFALPPVRHLDRVCHGGARRFRGLTW